MTANSDRSRLANASVISLTAVRLSQLRPSLSANSASTSRVDSPRAYISTSRALQLIGAAPHHLSDARAERLLPIRHLRRAVLDGALRAVHATPWIAIAISGAGAGAAGVVIAPHRVPRFAFQRLLGLHRIRTRDLLIKDLRNSQISPMRLYSGERGELI